MIFRRLMSSIIRQRFTSTCEDAINNQISKELKAFYVYLSMAYYFERSDTALPGFSKYFKNSAQEELLHAEHFMTYMNKRGGTIVLQPICKPGKDDWVGAENALHEALELEKSVTDSLVELGELADKENDRHLSDFIDGFIKDQVDEIKNLGDLITRLKLCGDELGEFIFDSDFQKKA